MCFPAGVEESHPLGRSSPCIKDEIPPLRPEPHGTPVGMTAERGYRGRMQQSPLEKGVWGIEERGDSLIKVKKPRERVSPLLVAAGVLP